MRGTLTSEGAHCMRALAKSGRDTNQKAYRSENWISRGVPLELTILPKGLFALPMVCTSVMAGFAKFSWSQRLNDGLYLEETGLDHLAMEEDDLREYCALRERRVEVHGQICNSAVRSVILRLSKFRPLKGG